MNLQTTTALVIARYGQHIDVEINHKQIERITLQRKFNGIVTGDRVTLVKQPDWIIQSCLPRTSVLQKQDTPSKIKPIAANIDQLCLIIAPKPKPTLALIDDYLIMAEALRIKPAIVVNKMDLPETTALYSLLDIYQSLPYPIIFISALKATHLADLTNLLQGKTNILVGQSGVGKSSIVQQLIPDAMVSIHALSHQQKTGTHTTTATKLYHLACKGHLIDSPGVRSFTLWSMDPKKIASYFIEFQPYLGHCRFNDCMHLKEPGCAILSAVQEGNISESRYESYQRLMKK